MCVFRFALVGVEWSGCSINCFEYTRLWESVAEG